MNIRFFLITAFTLQLFSFTPNAEAFWCVKTIDGKVRGQSTITASEKAEAQAVALQISNDTGIVAYVSKCDQNTRDNQNQ